MYIFKISNILGLLHVNDFANHESSGIFILHNSRGFIHGVHDFNGLIMFVHIHAFLLWMDYGGIHHIHG
jgi:hypothetical protein